MAKTKLSLFNRIVFLINNIFALALLISYCGWFINPSKVPIMGIISLIVPALMAVNLLFILYWLVLRKRQMMLSIICLAAGWWHFNALYQFGDSTSYHTEKPPIRVMTFNVQLYYANHPWKKTYSKVEDMVNMMNDINPDIFCIQEFQSARKWVPKQHLKYKVTTQHNLAHLAIYSAYPIINSGEIDYPQKNQEYDKFLYADVNINGDTIRVLNVHLASIGLDNKDLQTFTQIDAADEEKVKKSSEKIYGRLINAYERRGIQTLAIAEFIENSPYRVILCGDLNDTPTTYAYKKLSKKLKDSFVLAGHGFGTSHVRFSTYHIPVRIDHIFADKALIPRNWQIIREEHSDHFPVVVDFTF